MYPKKFIDETVFTTLRCHVDVHTSVFFPGDNILFHLQITAFQVLAVSAQTGVATQITVVFVDFL